MVKIIGLVLILLLGSTHDLFSQWRDSSWNFISTKDFERYANWVNGSFSSRLQSQEEPYFSNVQVNQVVFEYGSIGIWMYIEQGMYGEPPYRKRVYRTYMANDTTIISKTFMLKSPNLYSFKDEDLLNKLNTVNLDSLIYIKGCDVSIHMGVDKIFYGQLQAGRCEGSYAGATHTTSEFRIYSNMIVSWERGWRGSTQVWGSSRGYYYFRREE